MLFAILFVALGQDAVASGELRKLERFAGRIEVVVRHHGSNLLSRSALRELSRWPGTPVVELQAPLTRVEARALRDLKRLAVRMYQGSKVPRYQLRRLGPALLRVDEAALLEPRPSPCAGAELGRSGDTVELRIASADACVSSWIASQFEPAPSAPAR